MFQSNQKTVLSIFEFNFNKIFDSVTSFIQKLCDKISSLCFEFSEQVLKEITESKEFNKNLRHTMSIEIADVDNISNWWLFQWFTWVPCVPKNLEPFIGQVITFAREEKNPYGAIPEKSKQGGLRIWNFKGYQINSTWNFQGLIKKEVEFPSVTKKKECGISRGLCFWLWNVQRI